MAIRKISELPFVNFDENTLSAGIVELSRPESAAEPNKYVSNAMLVNDFKTYVIKDLSAKNTFPHGIYISSFTDIVGTLSVNTRTTGNTNSTNVYINGDPVKIESATTLELSSPNTKFYATSGPVGVYTDPYDETGIIQMYRLGGNSDSARVTIPTTTTTTLYNTPLILQSGKSILQSGGNAAVNVDAMQIKLDDFKAYVDEQMSKLGSMAYCDYFVSDQKSPKVPNNKTFYFYIQYYGYGM